MFNVSKWFKKVVLLAGFAAMGWSARGVASFRLPGDSAASAERAVLKRFPDAVAQAPSDRAQAVIDGAQRYFAGEHIDFASGCSPINTPIFA